MPVHVVRAFEPFPTSVRRTLFLAGPTPRRPDEVPSWRPEAIRILTELGFDGHVFVPEAKDESVWKDGFELQEEWEDEGLHRADALVFWVPRDFTPDSKGKPKMPGGTTNIEFGEHMKGGHVILGCPPNAAQVGAMKKKAERYGIPVFDNLRATLEAAQLSLGDGALREGGECCVPLDVWRSERFQEWYRARERGVMLDSVRVMWRFPFGNQPFTSTALAVKMIDPTALCPLEFTVTL